MIAINHPALGMNPHQSGGDWTPIYGPGSRAVMPQPLQPVRSVQTTQPVAPPAPAPATVHALPPAPSATPPQPLPIDLQAAVPASAGATGGTDAAAAAASAPFSLSDWLTEETLFPGYPNGLVAAGGVIVLAWIMGGKKGRR
jgi:hypothetical protein